MLQLESTVRVGFRVRTCRQNVPATAQNVHLVFHDLLREVELLVIPCLLF